MPPLPLHCSCRTPLLPRSPSAWPALGCGPPTPPSPFHLLLCGTSPTRAGWARRSWRAAPSPHPTRPLTHPGTSLPIPSPPPCHVRCPPSRTPAPCARAVLPSAAIPPFCFPPRFFTAMLYTTLRMASASPACTGGALLRHPPVHAPRRLAPAKSPCLLCLEYPVACPGSGCDVAAAAWRSSRLIPPAVSSPLLGIFGVLRHEVFCIHI
jgi:hypothetical protein